VSRFLLLLVFLIWMGWRADGDAPAHIRATDLSLFFGLYALMVVTLGLWSRLLARRVASRGAVQRFGMKYFNRIVFAAQFFVPMWLAVGVFFLGWGPAVQRMLGPVSHWPVQLPGAIIGTLPAFAAWAALWWSQYPADRALREQNLLFRVEEDLPIYTSPSFRDYVRQNFRLQILFLAVPVLLILAVHDVAMIILWRAFRMTNVEGSWIEGVVTLLSALSVFLVAPLILAKILGGYSLPPSPLRDRMEAMCRMHRLRFKDILLWPTQNRIANALVMGVAPQFRYVLLSDLLLAEMTDEQIEAVFAHELGHCVHRHMIWYLVFMKVLVLALLLVTVGLDFVDRHWFTLPAWMPGELATTLIGFGAFLVAFGYVSRRFERQADVFAARTLERHYAPVAAQAPGTNDAHSHVGPLGASVFASALERVALINNMPLGSPRRLEGNLMQRVTGLVEQFADLANNWLHGSIPTRMRALHRMATDPRHTRLFDRKMSRLYVTIMLALVCSAVVVWMVKLPV
jgi:STE24 endopeptidase